MSKLGNSVKHEGKGPAVLTRKLSGKESEPSPSPEKKLSTTKSNLPKSINNIKSTNSHNRPQSSYGVSKDRDSDSNPETKTSSKPTSRYNKSKTPLGISSKSTSKRNDISGIRRSRHSVPHLNDSVRNDPSDGLAKSDSPTSSCESSPSSPTSSPKLEASLEASDEIFIPENKPEEAVKPPFTIAMAEPEEATHEGNCSRQCLHSHLLAYKIRAPKKRTGQLRDLKSRSNDRIATLNDYLSIYEERLGRVNNDHSLLMKDAQLKCDEMIRQISARWEALKGQIEQDYEYRIEEAETHKKKVAEELKQHEILQRDSSTLYDICDLEEDNQDLTNWVKNLKERYSDVLTNSHNTSAMEFLSEISVESIDRMRKGIEMQVSQLYNKLPELSTPETYLSPRISQTSNPTSPLNSDSDNPLIPNTQSPLIHNTQNPLMPNTQNLLMPNTQNPLMPNTQNPLMLNTQNPLMPNTQNPLIPNTQNPLMPNTQNPLIPNTQNPRNLNNEIKRNPSNENPRLPKSQKLRTSNL